MIRNSVAPKTAAVREVSKLKDRTTPVAGYACLCPWLTLKLRKVCFLNACMSSLFGVPNYVWVLLVSFMLASVAGIAWLTYTVMTFKSINVSYYAKCASNLDCNSSLGLQCATVDRLCDCPVYYAKGHCDCSAGYYWSGSKCSQLLQNKESGCTADYSCDPKKDLRCVNKVCMCAPPKQWNATLNACDYVFQGCSFESSGFTSIFRGVIITKQQYFVDMCVDLCFKTRYTYALVASFWNPSSTNHCGCKNSINAESNFTCTAFSYGLNGQPYACGLVNSDTRWRAVYRVIY